MALFDSIIEETGEKFDLTADQSKALLAALLDLINDAKTGGFSAFANRFSNSGFGDAFSSQTIRGESTSVTKDQIESSLGAETIAALADRAGLDYATTVSAMTFLIPATINRLTSNGSLPDEQIMRSAISELSGEPHDLPSNAGTARNRLSTEAFDRVGSAVEDIGEQGHNITSDNRIGDFALVGDKFSGAPAAVSSDMLAENSAAEFNDDSPLKWLVPLIITALLVALGFWFCGGKTAEHASVDADTDLIKTFII